MKQLDIDTLISDPANVRAHDERNIAAIKASLLRFGQQKPIVVDPDGVVIAGNGTLEAARQLGWEKISVTVSQLKGADRTAYAIADNRTAELATWDDAALAEQLAALQNDESIDEALTGFDASEIERHIFTLNPQFEPVGEDSQSRLDSKQPVECPHCGKEFVPE